MKAKLFGKKVKVGAGPRLAFLGRTPRADWRAVLLVGAISVAWGAFYAQSRLGAIREAAAAGEVRHGGEGALDASEAAEVVRGLEARGPAPTAAAASAATSSPAAGTAR